MGNNQGKEKPISPEEEVVKPMEPMDRTLPMEPKNYETMKKSATSMDLLDLNTTTNKPPIHESNKTKPDKYI
jgi:hypothetical protein